MKQSKLSSIIQALLSITPSLSLTMDMEHQQDMDHHQDMVRLNTHLNILHNIHLNIQRKDLLQDMVPHNTLLNNIIESFYDYLLFHFREN